MEAHVAWLPYKPYMGKVGVYWANFNEQTQKIYGNGENVSTKTFIAVLFMTRWHSIGRNLVVCCLVAKSCQTLYDLVDCSPPGLPVLHYLSKFAQTQVHWSVVPSHHLVLCFLLLLTYSSRERENQETRWHKSGDFAPVAPRRKAVKIEVKVSSPSAFFQEASSSVLHSKSNEELSNNLYSSSTKEPSDPQF